MASQYQDALSRKDLTNLKKYFADDAKHSESGNLVASDFSEIESRFKHDFDNSASLIETFLSLAFYADEGNG
ncbi:MAG: hypothetical protein ACKOEH_06095, partial [Actinomycetota bacterium]